MRIGIIPDPEQHPHWADFKAFLEPAAKRGQLDTILGPHELLWAVFDGDTPIAAATTRLTVDNTAEVVLVGGVGHRKWLTRLDDMIGACAVEAGAFAVRASGRRGWSKILQANGWEIIGQSDDMTVYEKVL